VRTRLLLALSILMVVWLAISPAARLIAPARAATPEPEDGPNRKTTLVVSFTRYEWWLSRWETGQFLCSVIVEHEGLPASGEILYDCGSTIHNEWKNTKPCPEAEGVSAPLQCSGVILHLVRTTKGEREISIDLPPPVAWVSISGCSPAPPQNRCSQLPNLLITGEEPLPNETIISVQGLFNGEPFSCMGSTCNLPLPATGRQGVQVEFWVESSFGDSSQHFTALVRVVPWGNFAAPEGNTQDAPLWYVDVLSTQWRGAPLASCAQTWESFPDVGGPPLWLTTPERVEELASSETLYYLAGQLIQSGQVNAEDCPNGGLESAGIANACGIEKSRPAVTAWQNQFDAQILQVAREMEIPAQLMKSVFARESQFWPGIFRSFREAGLGQLTENGADTVLLWNPSFFNQFCPLVFEKSVCQNGFAFLNEEHQNLLKGALVNKVNAACPDCPAGIDLSQASFSVNVFAGTLRASCDQAGQIVYNTTGAAAGLSSSYVDLWRFTLVNYNAGPGCLSEAVLETFNARQPLDWTNVSSHLDEACQGAIPYVEEISTLKSVGPTPTPPAVLPTLSGPRPTFAPTPTRQLTPGVPTPTLQPGVPTATPIATDVGYPYPEPPTITPGPSPTSETYPYP